jgi:hypothetical protein
VDDEEDLHRLLDRLELPDVSNAREDDGLPARTSDLEELGEWG